MVKKVRNIILYSLFVSFFIKAEVLNAQNGSSTAAQSNSSISILSNTNSSAIVPSSGSSSSGTGGPNLTEGELVMGPTPPSKTPGGVCGPGGECDQGLFCLNRGPNLAALCAINPGAALGPNGRPIGSIGIPPAQNPELILCGTGKYCLKRYQVCVSAAGKPPFCEDTRDNPCSRPEDNGQSGLQPIDTPDGKGVVCCLPGAILRQENRDGQIHYICKKPKICQDEPPPSCPPGTKPVPVEGPITAKREDGRTIWAGEHNLDSGIQCVKLTVAEQCAQNKTELCGNQCCAVGKKCVLEVPSCPNCKWVLPISRCVAPHEIPGREVPPITCPPYLLRNWRCSGSCGFLNNACPRIEPSTSTSGSVNIPTEF